MTTYSKQQEYGFIFYTLFKNYQKGNDSGDNVEIYFVGDIWKIDALDAKPNAIAIDKSSKVPT